MQFSSSGYLGVVHKIKTYEYICQILSEEKQAQTVLVCDHSIEPLDQNPGLTINLNVLLAQNFRLPA